MVAAPHSQQNPGIMRNAVGESINPPSRQANSKKTACDFRIAHHTPDLTQTTPGNFGIDMDKPKNVAVCDTRPSVHLYRAITLAYNKLIAKTAREISRAVVASPVGDNNFRFWRSVTQMLKKWAYK
jgi:hypothetical protein